MNCSDFLDQHSNFVDLHLSERESAAMEAHRSGCSGCARYDALVRKVPGLLQVDGSPSPIFRQQLIERLRSVDSERVEHARTRRIRRTTLSGAGASIALLVAAWLPVMLTTGNPVPDEWTLDTLIAMRPRLTVRSIAGMFPSAQAASRRVSTAAPQASPVTATIAPLSRRLPKPISLARDLAVPVRHVREDPSLLEPVQLVHTVETENPSSLLSDYGRMLRRARASAEAPREN